MNISDSRLSLLWERYDNNWMHTFRISPKQMRMMSISDRPIARLCKVCGQFHSPVDSHLYDYHEQINDDLTCDICLQPLVNPVDTQCGHTFCSNCIRNFLKIQNACPNDRNPLQPTDLQSSSLIIRRLLDKLEVVCPNVDYCETVVTRSELEAHLQHRCRGAVVNCKKYKYGCRYQGPRGSMESHDWDCNYRDKIDEGLMRQIVPGEQTEITIQRRISDLGLSIVGGTDTLLGGIHIQEILTNSVIDIDNRLQPGDQILEVGGHDLTNATHCQAIKTLKKQKDELLVLKVLRDQVAVDSCDAAAPIVREDILKVTLVKKPSIPLGIKLSGKRKQEGVFIMDILPNSVASEDEQLRIGDKILEINSDGFSVSSQQSAASSISASHGKISFIVARVNRPMTPDLLKSILHATPPPSSFPLFSEPQNDFIEKTIVVQKKRGESLGLSVAGGLHSQRGNIPLYVMSLVPGGPTEAHQVKRGDVVLSVNGAEINGLSHSDAVHILKTKVNHKKVELRLLEWVRPADYSVELGQRCFVPPWSYWQQQPRSCWIETNVKIHTSQDFPGLGLSLTLNTPQSIAGACVRQVMEDSPASQANIRCGDIITKVDGNLLTSVSSPRELKILMERATSKPKTSLTIISWPGSIL